MQCNLKSRLLWSRRLMFVGTAVLAACGPGAAELGALKDRSLALEAENKRLALELDELRNGAERLFALATEAETRKQHDQALEHLDTLLRIHPEAPRAEAARQLIVEIRSELERVAEEASASARRNQEALSQQAEIRRRRLAGATAAMDTTVDKIERITWYTDRQHSREVGMGSDIRLYFGVKDDHPWLRMKVQYYAHEWLFIESFLVVADGQRFEYNNITFERDNSTSIWEWHDRPVDDRDMAMILAVLRSGEATVRFCGRQYKRDLDITSEHREAMYRVLCAYEAMGGAPAPDVPFAKLGASPSRSLELRETACEDTSDGTGRRIKRKYACRPDLSESELRQQLLVEWNAILTSIAEPSQPSPASALIYVFPETKPGDPPAQSWVALLERSGGGAPVISVRGH